MSASQYGIEWNLNLVSLGFGVCGSMLQKQRPRGEGRSISSSPAFLLLINDVTLAKPANFSGTFLTSKIRGYAWLDKLLCHSHLRVSS